MMSYVEIEAIINARPLSYISTEDMEEPLTALAPAVWTQTAELT